MSPVTLTPSSHMFPATSSVQSLLCNLLPQLSTGEGLSRKGFNFDTKCPANLSHMLTCQFFVCPGPMRMSTS